jgi:hypothetical protein
MKMRPSPVPRRERLDFDRKHADPAPPTHFGPYRVSASLISILEEIGDPALSRRFSKHFTAFCFGLNQLDHLPHMQFRRLMIRDYHQTFQERLEDAVPLEVSPDVLKAWHHLFGVLRTHARVKIRELNQEIHETWLEMTADERKRAADVMRRAAKK